MQISVGKVDENGRYTGENQVYALCGFVRSRAESDDSMNRLAQRDGFLKSVWSGSQTRDKRAHEKELERMEGRLEEGTLGMLTGSAENRIDVVR